MTSTCKLRCPLVSVVTVGYAFFAAPFGGRYRCDAIAMMFGIEEAVGYACCEIGWTNTPRTFFFQRGFRRWIRQIQ